MAYLCFLLDPSDDVNGLCRTFPLPESEECCREVAVSVGLDTFPQQGGIEFVQRAKEGDRTIISQKPGVSFREDWQHQSFQFVVRQPFCEVPDIHEGGDQGSVDI